MSAPPVTPALLLVMPVEGRPYFDATGTQPGREGDLIRRVLLDLDARSPRLADAVCDIAETLVDLRHPATMKEESRD